ncbi:uncharacterized protein LOC130449988 [Diorhabda sublineata]|uniref:uncharacterized protein LOC130449988 n=1 Tax=Diorhabda sublineata TaxID=1163346 RepID=UPI0024E05963|nr:uncharacterized protein LOC130449988 [Diorhabda sublineata]
MKHNRYNKPNYPYSYRPSPWAYDDYSYGRDHRSQSWTNGSRAPSPPRSQRWRPPPPKRKQNGGSHSDAKKSKKDDKPSGIQMFVTTAEFPTTSLTEEQLELLQTSILNEITKIAAEDFHPQFLDCFKRRGNLIIVCNNQDSVNWLKTTVPSLAPWEGAQCKALEPSEVPNLMDILITIPGELDADTLLHRIEKQNEDIQTANWNLTSKKQDESKKNTTYTFAVEENVVEQIKKLNYKLFINFSRIHVRYLGSLRSKDKSKSENDEVKTDEAEEKTEGAEIKTENADAATEELNIDPEEIVGSLTNEELKAVTDAN